MGELILFYHYFAKQMGEINKNGGTIEHIERRGDAMSKENFSTESSYEKLVNVLKNQAQTSSTEKDAEALADRVLSECGYKDNIGPTPIINITKKFGFSTFASDNMEKNISGYIFVGGTTKDIYQNDKVILVNAKEAYQHQRFVIAHELAHYVMECLGNKKFESGDLLFKQTYPKENHDSKQEKLADRFAAELLMPSALFCKQYLKAMEESDCNKAYTVTYLSTFFDTKKSSVERRIAEVLS